MLLYFIQVNTNGALSFTTSISEYTDDQFPTDTGYKTIAPFWADVDTTGIGNVTYRVTTDADLLRRANDHVRRGFPDKTFSSNYLFIATWDHVGFWDAQTRKVIHLAYNMYVHVLCICCIAG